MGCIKIVYFFNLLRVPTFNELYSDGVYMFYKGLTLRTHDFPFLHMYTMDHSCLYEKDDFAEV